MSLQNTTTAAAGNAPVSAPVTWAIAFLKGIGAPVTPQNINTIIAWGTAESGNPTGPQQAYGGWANNNPLNVVVQSNDQHTGMGGSQGDIANFGSIAAGAAASARLFKNNGNAAGIIAALKGNQSVGIVERAVNAFYSQWGGHISFSGIAPNTTGGAGGNTGGNAVLTGLPNPLSIGGDVLGGILGVPGSIIGASPLGGLVDAGKATAALAGTIIGIFANWRYVLEVGFGITMMGLGIVLIMHDIGADKKIAQSAGVVALAA
jgi:hypothetical protein